MPRGVIQRHDIFVDADFLCSYRQYQILARYRIDDVLRRETVGLQLAWIDIRLNLSRLSTKGGGNRGSGDGRELWPNEVLRIIE